MAGQPEIVCEKCGDTPAKILRTAVTYATTMDMETRHTAHYLASTVHSLKCPQCGHAFSVSIAEKRE